MAKSSQPPQQFGGCYFPKSSDPNFLSIFYSHSRLHHLTTWKAKHKAFVRKLQENGDTSFPGLQRLKKLVEEKRGGGGICRREEVKGAEDEKDQQMAPFPENVIMHIDIDCFFAAVSLKSYPELQGKPVAVAHYAWGPNNEKQLQLKKESQDRRIWADTEGNCNGQEDRLEENIEDLYGGVSAHRQHWQSYGLPDSEQDNFMSLAEIASCNYEARQANVRNGMIMRKAKELCPELQTIPYDFEGYYSVSKQLYEIVAEYTHNIEACSCDELLLDISKVLQETGASPLEFAQVLRDEICAKTQCTASAGLAPSAVLARLCTRVAKPNGMYQLIRGKEGELLNSISVRELPGVGGSISKKLQTLGIYTCFDLQQLTLDTMQTHFGNKTGEILYLHCRGKDNRPIRMEKERKYVSVEVNYGIRFKDETDVINFIFNLSQELQKRLKDLEMAGRTLTVKLKVRRAGTPKEDTKFMGYGVYDNKIRSATLPQETDDLGTIRRECRNILLQMKAPPSDIRGVGVQISRLKKASCSSKLCKSLEDMLVVKSPGTKRAVKSPEQEPSRPDSNDKRGKKYSLLNFVQPKRTKAPVKEDSPNVNRIKGLLSERKSSLGTDSSATQNDKNNNRAGSGQLKETCQTKPDNSMIKMTTEVAVEEPGAESQDELFGSRSGAKVVMSKDLTQDCGPSVKDREHIQLKSSFLRDKTKDDDFVTESENFGNNNQKDLLSQRKSQKVDNPWPCEMPSKIQDGCKNKIIGRKMTKPALKFTRTLSECLKTREGTDRSSRGSSQPYGEAAEDLKSDMPQVDDDLQRPLADGVEDYETKTSAVSAGISSNVEESDKVEVKGPLSSCNHKLDTVAPSMNQDRMDIADVVTLDASSKRSNNRDKEVRVPRNGKHIATMGNDHVTDQVTDDQDIDEMANDRKKRQTDIKSLSSAVKPLLQNDSQSKPSESDLVEPRGLGSASGCVSTVVTGDPCVKDSILPTNRLCVAGSRNVSEVAFDSPVPSGRCEDVVLPTFQQNAEGSVCDSERAAVGDASSGDDCQLPCHGEHTVTVSDGTTLKVAPDADENAWNVIVPESQRQLFGTQSDPERSSTIHSQSFRGNKLQNGLAWSSLISNGAGLESTPCDTSDRKDVTLPNSKGPSRHSRCDLKTAALSQALSTNNDMMCGDLTQPTFISNGAIWESPPCGVENDNRNVILHNSQKHSDGSKVESENLALSCAPSTNGGTPNSTLTQPTLVPKSASLKSAEHASSSSKDEIPCHSQKQSIGSKCGSENATPSHAISTDNEALHGDGALSTLTSNGDSFERTPHDENNVAQSHGTCNQDGISHSVLEHSTPTSDGDLLLNVQHDFNDIENVILGSAKKYSDSSNNFPDIALEHKRQGSKQGGTWNVPGGSQKYQKIGTLECPPHEGESQLVIRDISEANGGASKSSHLVDRMDHPGSLPNSSVDAIQCNKRKCVDGSEIGSEDAGVMDDAAALDCSKDIVRSKCSEGSKENVEWYQSSMASTADFNHWKDAGPEDGHIYPHGCCAVTENVDGDVDADVQAKPSAAVPSKENNSIGQRSGIDERNVVPVKTDDSSRLQDDGLQLELQTEGSRPSTVVISETMAFEEESIENCRREISRENLLCSNPQHGTDGTSHREELGSSSFLNGSNPGVLLQGKSPENSNGVVSGVRNSQETGGRNLPTSEDVAHDTLRGPSSSNDTQRSSDETTVAHSSTFCSSQVDPIPGGSEGGSTPICSHRGSNNESLSQENLIPFIDSQDLLDSQCSQETSFGKSNVISSQDVGNFLFSQEDSDSISSQEQSAWSSQSVFTSSSKKIRNFVHSVDPEFLSLFFSNSRYHYLSTWKNEHKDFVNNLQKIEERKLPGKEKLQVLLNTTDTEDSETEDSSKHSGPIGYAPSSQSQVIQERGFNCKKMFEEKTVVMHLDMDCFFVAVSLLNYPELRGKPLAVAHTGTKASKQMDTWLEDFERAYLEKKLWTCPRDKSQETDVDQEPDSGGPNVDGTTDKAGHPSDGPRRTGEQVKDEMNTVVKRELDSNSPLNHTGDCKEDSVDSQQDSQGEVIHNNDDGLNMVISLGSCPQSNPMSEIASCSYEARAFGVEKGMLLSKAKEFCPHLQTIPYDFENYHRVSRILYETVAGFTNEIEAVSCDEMFIDITKTLRDTGASPLEFAQLVLDEIFAKTQCTASAGIASNTLLARLCTQVAKPNGIYLLEDHKVGEFMRNIPVKVLPGVGGVTRQKLSSLNITTCSELQELSLPALQSQFGQKQGHDLYHHCRGRNDQPIKVESPQKLVSSTVNYGIRFNGVCSKIPFVNHDPTFSIVSGSLKISVKPLNQLCNSQVTGQSESAEALKFVADLATVVHKKLKKTGMAGRTIMLKAKIRRRNSPQHLLKYGGYGICDNRSRTVTLKQETDDLVLIQKESQKLLLQLKAAPKDIRGVGICISRLTKAKKGSSPAKTIKDMLVKRGSEVIKTSGPTQSGSYPDSFPEKVGAMSSWPYSEVPDSAPLDIKPFQLTRSTEDWRESNHKSIFTKSRQGSSPAKTIKDLLVIKRGTEASKSPYPVGSGSGILKYTKSMTEKIGRNFGSQDPEVYDSEPLDIKPFPLDRPHEDFTPPVLPSPVFTQDEILSPLFKPVSMFGPKPDISKRRAFSTSDLSSDYTGSFDPDVLKELPPDILEEVLDEERTRMIKCQNLVETLGHVEDLPEFTDVDPTCLDALPPEIQGELFSAYKRRASITSENSEMPEKLEMDILEKSPEMTPEKTREKTLEKTPEKRGFQAEIRNEVKTKKKKKSLRKRYGNGGSGGSGKSSVQRNLFEVMNIQPPKVGSRRHSALC